jgi:hypothetical protein
MKVMSKPHWVLVPQMDYDGPLYQRMQGTKEICERNGFD